MAIDTWIKSQHMTQLAPLWTIKLTTKSGSSVNLSGLIDSAMAIYFKNVSNGKETQGAGVLHIVQTNPAIVSYQADVADVVIGNYGVRLWITFQNGPEPYDLGIWPIEP